MYNNPLHPFTRYYKGPSSEPKENADNKRLLWGYKQLWVENENERSEDHHRMLEYINDVLPLFNEDDGIPLSLKALLYNRYTHWMGGYSLEQDVKEFREFLYEHYRPDLL